MITSHMIACLFTELNQNQVQKVDQYLSHMHLSDETLLEISRQFQKEMEKELGATTNPTAVMKMLPTFVRSTPDRTEHGEFLALDLGGTNLLVLLVRMTDNDLQKVEMKNQIYAIPEEIMRGSGTQLFDHIAECLTNFMDKLQNKAKKLPLGYTFWFLCHQEKLDKSFLGSWTKGFKSSCVEVGTIMACGYDDQNCETGLTVGTDINACYMEEMHHNDMEDRILKAYQILVSLGLNSLQEDCVVTHGIYQIVSTCSASLSAATLAAVLWDIKENKGEELLSSTIGVDGSVYKKHPHFARCLHKAVRRLVPDCDVFFLWSEDGSGKGAAMVMVVAYRLADQHWACQKTLGSLKLSHEQLLEVIRSMKEETEQGLSKETHAVASVKMLPT
ncbi:hypothetical protein NN561_018384 [Cricetulus griseus]